jgi:cobalamin-dependent methionine synthase I
VKQLRDDYENCGPAAQLVAAKLLELEAARANAPKLNFDDLPKPEFTGRARLNRINPGKCDAVRRTLAEFSGDAKRFIDWTPFFHTWELRGVYPKDSQHEKHGEEARKLFADAQEDAGRNHCRKMAATPRRLRPVSRPIASATTWKLYTDDGSRKTSAQPLSFSAPAN